MSLKAKNLSFSYEQNKIFEKVNLHIRKGQISCFVGPNGAGKSTLIKCLNKIFLPEEGVVFIDGKEISSLKPRDLAKVMGYVPQNEKDTFSISVFEAVLLGRRPYIQWRVRKEDIKIVESILAKLKITHLAEREIQTLSGGERQKVAIARALAQKPSILLLDEPTSNLDMNHQLEIMELLSNLAHDNSVTIIMVIHDLNLAARYSDEVFLFGKKGIHVCGSPFEVFTIDNLKEVYGVEVEIIQTSQGAYIVPLKSV
ncbi:MAG: ABC transporter ATP-binding protein [Halanaerobiales bacterium]|nr:ABC transporter ATP-binding protein [Halanaerobiales bacterium]